MMASAHASRPVHSAYVPRNKLDIDMRVRYWPCVFVFQDTPGIFNPGSPVALTGDIAMQQVRSSLDALLSPPPPPAAAAAAASPAELAITLEAVCCLASRCEAQHLQHQLRKLQHPLVAQGMSKQELEALQQQQPREQQRTGCDELVEAINACTFAAWLHWVLQHRRARSVPYPQLNPGEGSSGLAGAQQLYGVSAA
jgi:hypothetical protein